MRLRRVDAQLAEHAPPALARAAVAADEVGDDELLKVGRGHVRPIAGAGRGRKRRYCLPTPCARRSFSAMIASTCGGRGRALAWAGGH